jgi:hypothetical protein
MPSYIASTFTPGGSASFKTVRYPWARFWLPRLGQGYWRIHRRTAASDVESLTKSSILSLFANNSASSFSRVYRIIRTTLGRILRKDDWTKRTECFVFCDPCYRHCTNGKWESKNERRYLNAALPHILVCRKSPSWTLVITNLLLFFELSHHLFIFAVLHFHEKGLQRIFTIWWTNEQIRNSVVVSE